MLLVGLNDKLIFLIFLTVCLGDNNVDEQCDTKLRCEVIKGCVPYIQVDWLEMPALTAS